MKCPQVLAHALVHGTTHRVPHHVALAGTTHQVSRQAQALVILAQAGQVQALAIPAQVLHQAGINYVFC